MGCKANVEKGY